MAEVIVDTAFLACPRAGATAADYEAYVNRLLDVEKLSKREWPLLLVSANLIEVLETAGRMPPWTASPVDEFIQKEDVARLLFGILSKLTTVQDYTQFGLLLLDKCRWQPPGHLDGYHSALIADCEQLSALVGLARISAPKRCDQARMLCPAQPSQSAVLFECTVEDLDGGDGKELPTVPFELNTEIEHCKNSTTLFDLMDPLDLWIARQFEFSIRRAALMANGEQPRQLRDFAFGTEFIRTIKTLGFGHEPTKVRALLRTIVETVANVVQRDTHWLRTSAGGNARQRTRGSDGATAWRRDITDEFHLHYWETPLGVELSAVVVHNDFAIPE